MAGAELSTGAAGGDAAAPRQVRALSARDSTQGAGPQVRSAALSAVQINAVRASLALFVEDDVARGVPAFSRIFCDACQLARPAAGFIQYGRYAVCNACAIEYEVAHARGLLSTPGQYVRDKAFGEAEVYRLPG